MKLSKKIEFLEDYFFNKQWSYKHDRLYSCFQIDFFNIVEFCNIKKILKKRYEKILFRKHLSNYFRQELFNNCVNRKSDTRKDPTIDQYIQEKGGIKSHADNKVYTTKSSYLDSLKSKGYNIHE